MGVRPALVLGLQDTPCQVTQSDQSGETFSGQRAVRSEGGATVNHGNGLASDELTDSPIIGYEKAPFTDMTFKWRRCKSGTNLFPVRRRLKWMHSGKQRMAW